MVDYLAADSAVAMDVIKKPPNAMKWTQICEMRVVLWRKREAKSLSSTEIAECLMVATHGCGC